MQQKLMNKYNKKYSQEDQQNKDLKDITYAAPENYNEHYDHMVNFFNGVRTGAPVVEDPTFGLRAAGPCLACNESYFQNKIIYWDPEKIKTV
jgi:hypothetical protein